MSSLIEKMTCGFDDEQKINLFADEFLNSFDIAAVNLGCARGLPGSETIDIEADLAWFDDVAYQVDFEIKRNYHHFLRDPKRYDNSQAKWCVLMLITVIQ